MKKHYEEIHHIDMNNVKYTELSEENNPITTLNIFHNYKNKIIIWHCKGEMLNCNIFTKFIKI